MQRHRTMMPRPHGNPFPVEDLSDIVGVNTFKGKRSYPTLPIRLRAEDPHTGHFCQPLKGILSKGMLVGGYIFHPDRIQIIHRCAKPDRLGDCRGAGFELVRQVIGGKAAQLDSV